MRNSEREEAFVPRPVYLAFFLTKNVMTSPDLTSSGNCNETWSSELLRTIQHSSAVFASKICLVPPKLKSLLLLYIGGTKIRKRSRFTPICKMQCEPLTMLVNCVQVHLTTYWTRYMYHTGLWYYQILLLVHGQVNGQNPLVQPRFNCPKIDIFFLFL